VNPNEIRKGFTFTHASLLDPDWEPKGDQTYLDCPKAKCIVTYTTRGTIFFGYVGTPISAFRASRGAFAMTYGKGVGNE